MAHNSTEQGLTHDEVTLDAANFRASVVDPLTPGQPFWWFRVAAARCAVAAGDTVRLTTATHSAWECLVVARDEAQGSIWLRLALPLPPPEALDAVAAQDAPSPLSLPATLRMTDGMPRFPD